MMQGDLCLQQTNVLIKYANLGGRDMTFGSLFCQCLPRHEKTCVCICMCMQAIVVALARSDTPNLVDSLHSLKKRLLLLISHFQDQVSKSAQLAESTQEGGTDYAALQKPTQPRACFGATPRPHKGLLAADTVRFSVYKPQLAHILALQSILPQPI